MSEKPYNKNEYKLPEKYPFPSQFGSHKSMVDEEATSQLNKSGLVVCKDDFGSYITDAWRLDEGLADPNRYVGRNVACMPYAKTSA